MAESKNLRSKNSSADENAYLKSLIDSHPLRKSALKSAVDIVCPPKGSRGLDAGCGSGLQTKMLAESVGPKGFVIGLDQSLPFLRKAVEIASKVAVPGSLIFTSGDVYRLPFRNNAFNWVWSTDCFGYFIGKNPVLLNEIARVVKPNGFVAILVWSSQTLLPGYPEFEARLNATAAGIAPFERGDDPTTHPLRLLGSMQRAGLKDAKVRTVAGEVQAPLSEPVRRALIDLFQMRWGSSLHELSAEDRELYDRLCASDSPECIMDVLDYYAFFTYSVFHATVVS